MIDAPELILQYVVSAIVMRGAATTLLITILSMALGIVVGLIIALLQQVRMKAIRFLVTAYCGSFAGRRCCSS